MKRGRVAMNEIRPGTGGGAARQHAEFRACVHAQELYAGAPTDRQPAVWAEMVHVVRHRRRKYLPTRLDVPDVQQPVPAIAQQQVAVRREDTLHPVILVSFQDPDWLPGGRVPEAEAQVVATGGDQPAAGVP